jgi:hypothetical protein
VRNTISNLELEYNLSIFCSQSKIKKACVEMDGPSTFRVNVDVLSYYSGKQNDTEGI